VIEVTKMRVGVGAHFRDGRHIGRKERSACCLHAKRAEAFGALMEQAMSNHSRSSRCAYCGNPFPTVEGRIQQWRVGDRYACNEFCAEGVESQAPERRAA
jgi:hypothetical protein